jgi:hypothetical protein
VVSNWKKKKKYKNEAEMNKVWSENKDKLIAELGGQIIDPLIAVLENEGQYRFESEMEVSKEKNLKRVEDKDIIMKFNKKFGVDDVIFNNKNVLFKIDMKVKDDVELELTDNGKNPK